MKDSEILRDLISLAFDTNPADATVTLQDGLDLLVRTVCAEQKRLSARFALTAPPPATEEEPMRETSMNACGRGAAEKREIYDRLTVYRAQHGLGCLAPVADATGGVVSEDELRAMLAGDRYPLAKWKVVGLALDFVEKKGQKKS